ncbi:MAG: acyl-CoA dehydratase activase [Treponema sp.]|nr:acyl-CoA dehydratase activase [Treponema sp.]
MANKDKPVYRLGIDLGSVSIAVALLDDDTQVAAKGYRLHHGDMQNALNGLLEDILRMADGAALCRTAICGANRDSVQAQSVNEITALIAGARFVAPLAHSVMEIGGQSSKYITGIRDGNVRFAINDTCSAGTGSFFEAQAGRLNIDLDAFSRLTEKSEAAPRIAGRCSVFAKTDIIHLQQDGEKIENILLGLCYAAARNYKAGVAGKLPFKRPALFAGGTAYNAGLLRAIRDVFGLGGEDLIVSEYAPYMSAIGAALCAGDGDAAGQPLAELRGIVMPTGEKPDRDESGGLPQLFASDQSAGNLHKTFPLKQGEACFLGIDIGSTSTNLVLLDQSCRVVDYQYLRTQGDPKNAVKQGFTSLAARFAEGLAISAVATTGSGRHFIGGLIGADGMYDEISAQAAAAAHFSPEADTVFEIGGQDSKYISIKGASVADFQMNKICAAGTGSFIEEQARKLNIPLNQFGNAALSAQTPCDLGERCTVFIETNINKELAKGASKEDIAAGLCYSVVKNYLHRVVANKPVGEHILLQGGVAHNSALVAAFKSEFGSRLKAAPYFSISGAIGAALMVRERTGGNTTSFKGLSCLEDIEKNEAQRHEAEAADAPLPKAIDPLLFNYRNEIDPDKKTIGIPRALVMYSLFPLFNAFFRALGYNVLISGESGEQIIELAQSYTKVEMCYPVKLAIGHAAQLAERGVDYIFFPALYALEKSKSKAPPGRVCVCMQKAPHILEASLGLAERGVTLITMDIDLSKGLLLLMKTLYRLGRRLEHRPVKCLNALKKGIGGMFGYMSAYMKNYQQSQKKAAGDAAAGKPEFVIVSRGYCLSDPVLSLGLKEMLEERDYRVSYVVHHHKLNIYQQYPNLYWSFGTFLLKTAKAIAASVGLYAVYPTYHGCGPDGILAHWFEDETGGKPCLSLEIDEHASKVGVITRLEAFVNSIHGYEKSASQREQGAPLMRDIRGFRTEIAALDKERPTIIPYCYPYSALFAACLRRMGYNAGELPPTSPESLARGRSFMRGKEYFSLTALLGDAAAYAETHRNAQLLFPQNGGVEVDGLYSYFVYTKLQDKLSVISPALDRMPEQEAAADTVFRILLAGDIALYSVSGDLARVMEAAFATGLPDDETLLRWARSNRGDGNRVLITGEPWCIHNALFQNTVIEQVRAAGLDVAFAPVSEMLLFEWQSRSKSAGKLEKLRYAIADVMEPGRFFAPSMTELKNTADRLCGNFIGGFGRYRIAKAAVYDGPHVSGVISAVSQHENTGSSLELLPVDHSLPFLGLQFDGDNNPVNQLKIDSFLDEIGRRRQQEGI